MCLIDTVQREPERELCAGCTVRFQQFYLHSQIIDDRMMKCVYLYLVVYLTAVKGLRVPRGAGSLVFISLFTFNLAASG